MKRDENRPAEQVETPQPSKKPYQAPAWEVEETFGSAGTIACAKVDTTSCPAGPVMS
jgi:hypothetical protein